jgi:hypothetical protein
MRTRGTGLLRIALATVFGFMSLVHGPVMTFAKASPAAAHRDMNARGHHHGLHHRDHAMPAESPSPAKPESTPVCYAFGCFVALDVVALGAPSAILNPIGTLSPAPAAALRADDIKPAVPPPRLHV